MAKYVNQHYFDKESKRMYYVLGASYAIANIQPNQDMTFTSSHRNLVEIVKDELECPHKVQRDKRGNHNSYWIELDNMVYMASKLDELGVAEDKIKRRFPENIRGEYLSHFVRGFFDAKARVYSTNKGATRIEIRFNKQFLSGLHNVLVKYTRVERHKPTGDCLTYGHSDSMKIHDFIYSDWRYTRRNGLHIPSKKRQFKTDYELNKYPSTIRYGKKIESVKKLLLRGNKPKQFYKRFYSSLPALYRAFKNATGMTTREFFGKKQKLD